MSVVYLDTHVAVWLQEGDVEQLSQAAKDAIETCHLLISPMVYLEFDYLFKRRRVRSTASKVFADLTTQFGVTLCNHSFAAVATEATEIDWVTDPFDRIIVAQSMANPKSRLVTADELIRSRYKRAVW